ncbi:HigA family addiction module antitoxin [Lentisphaera marina]|uniref:HigA family addiction module antitoxin n=1 Tax=Lentisphaera marina TaxID=1111041 RepID=UPI002365E949|nr:HigA family addiction module antitoxin [Lentisphaera marina]MDD7983860.1 HigA family addiction module antitoxin [Lentisphaera marina]
MPKQLKGITPGTLLKEGFLDDMGITPYRLAKETRSTQTAIMNIINNKSRITAEFAVKFSMFFGNSAQFWVNVQSKEDIRKAKEKIAEKNIVIEQYHY